MRAAGYLKFSDGIEPTQADYERGLHQMARYPNSLSKACPLCAAPRGLPCFRVLMVSYPIHERIWNVPHTERVNTRDLDPHEY
jgi:hypothetical protein